MKSINFTFKKNNETIINENSINCIKLNNKTTFIIENVKYTYGNNHFIKETNDEKINLDLSTSKCKITLKKHNIDLNLNIDVIENKNINNIITIKYKIETELNTINIITIKYI